MYPSYRSQYFQYCVLSFSAALPVYTLLSTLWKDWKAIFGVVNTVKFHFDAGEWEDIASSAGAKF